MSKFTDSLPKAKPYLDKKVIWRTGAELTDIKANFCNLFDKRGWVVYTPNIAGAYFLSGVFKEWMDIQTADGSTHIAFGDFNPGAYPGSPFTNPDLIAEPHKIRELVLAILNTPSADGKGYTPIIMMEGGGEGQEERVDNHWPIIMEQLKDLVDFILFCPGWELIPQDHCTTRLYYKMLQVLHDLGAKHIWVHLQPGRSSFSSNPVEDDDPLRYLGDEEIKDDKGNVIGIEKVWKTDEAGCYSHASGVYPEGILFQTPPVGDGDDLHQPYVNNPSSFRDRWNDCLYRLGLGNNGWRKIFVCAFEFCAYKIFRKQCSTETARNAADSLKEVSDSLGIKVGFGNGLPH